MNMPIGEQPIVAYFKQGILPINLEQAWLLKRRASRFTLVGDIMYQQFFLCPLLKCLNLDDVDYVIWEVHEGICGNHIGGRTFGSEGVARSIFLANNVGWCCSIHRNLHSLPKTSKFSHCPTKFLKTSTISTPCDQWNMDIVKPFPIRP